MPRYYAVAAMATGMLLSTAIVGKAQDRDPRTGLYAIWYGEAADLFLNQPYIRGGQIVLQWASVEPRQGSYDFSEIDAKLADFAQRGQFATLQINGNVKPAWLFDRVPYVNERLSVQVNDRRGTLMYWHPHHREAYLAMLRALSDHMLRSTRADRLLGIRMNLNALGTEHHHVPKEYCSPERWIVPNGATRSGLTAWTKQVDNAYVQAVVDTYIECFRHAIRIFVRNNISDETLQDYRTDFENGTLSWFHTSSEVEPRVTAGEMQYRRFHDYCRSGQTTAYAEPWASAWGHHGGQTDDRWCSPPQWNYWRLLFDLHCGVSYIALYSSDMRVAVEGKYHAQGVHLDDPGGVSQAEFAAAFRFAAKYAGYHASPETSPGAWVAFRENNIVRAANGIPADRRKLSTFAGDYNFLMKRLRNDKTKGLDVVNIGPEEQRFGAWARVLPAGESMQLGLDPVFAASLANGDVVIRVVYLDEADGALHIRLPDHIARQKLTGTGQWREFIVQGSGMTLAQNRSGEQIEIQANDAPIHLHMVEVQRGVR